MERGFPLPQYGNRDSWIPPKLENGVGQNQGSRAAPVRGGPISQGSGSLGETPGRLIPVDDAIVCGKESVSYRMTPIRSVAMGNGIMGHRNSCTTTPQENGIGENWNPVLPRNSYSQGNGATSWTLVTQGKPVPQGSNFVTVDKPVENENWGDLVRMYQDLLQQETLNLNKPAEDVCPTLPTSTARNIVNQVLVASTANRNSNANLNSSRGLNPRPISISSPGSNQTSTSLSCFRSDDPANWNCNLLAAIVRPKNRNSNPSPSPIPYPNRYSNQASASLSRFHSDDPANWNHNLLAALERSKKCSDGAQNNSVCALNQTSIQNSSTQVGSHLTGPSGVGSMVGNRQSHTFTSYKPIGGCNSNQLPTVVFPIPNRPCYDLNSPPRSELDAVSSGITGPIPFAPITPDTKRKYADSQWVPAKDMHENQRNEDAHNHYKELLQTAVDSTSSAVSTIKKEHLVYEEGDGLSIDLNRIPPEGN